jgi:hypothetical protein
LGFLPQPFCNSISNSCAVNFFTIDFSTGGFSTGSFSTGGFSILGAGAGAGFKTSASSVSFVAFDLFLLNK